MSRAIRFKVSAELVAECLQMPPLSEITGAEWIWSERSLMLTVTDPSFDEVPEMVEPPEVSPTITKDRVRWDWHLNDGGEVSERE